MPTRSSDIVEQYSVRAFGGGIGGLVALALAVTLFVYQGSGALIGLVAVLAFAGLAGIGYAIYNIAESRKVTDVGVGCPYCQYKNHLTTTPEKDFTCSGCHRLIPVVDGKPIPVQQVRCGYCNTLNYYSAKSEVLLCEDCNREIPIAVDDAHRTKRLAPGYAKVDDTNTYDLVFVSHDGHHLESLIGALQHMLALNRNQVKQLLEECPVTLLSGIPRMKAEMLQAQLAVHGATADYKVSGQ